MVLVLLTVVTTVKSGFQQRVPTKENTGKQTGVQDHPEELLTPRRSKVTAGKPLCVTRLAIPLIKELQSTAAHG